MRFPSLFVLHCFLHLREQTEKKVFALLIVFKKRVFEEFLVDSFFSSLSVSWEHVVYVVFYLEGVYMADGTEKLNKLGRCRNSFTK